MIAPLFKEDSPLAPLPQRVMLHLNRYKASFILAMAKALVPNSSGDLSTATAQVEEAVLELYERGMVDRLDGESFLAGQVVFIPGSQFRFSDVETVWYCVMEEVRSHVLRYTELKPLYHAEELPTSFHNLKHVMSTCNGNAVLTRLYRCKAADNKGAKEQIKKHLSEKSKGFKHWIKEGSLRLSVLVSSESRQHQVQKLITETFRTSPSIRESAGVSVTTVPTEETFERMVKEAV